MLAAHGYWMLLTELGSEKKFGRRPAGKLKALLEERDEFLLKQSETDHLVWYVRLAPGATVPRSSATAPASGATASGADVAHEHRDLQHGLAAAPSPTGEPQASLPQGGKSKGGKSKGGKSKPQTREIALEDADGPGTTLAEQIEEEEEGEEDLLGPLGHLDLSGSPDSDNNVAVGTSLEQALVSFFAPQQLAACRAAPRTSLYVGENAFEQAPSNVELGLLGHLQEDGKQDQVFINVTDPFCLITVGVQGSGKSHTTACILESCLLPFPPVVNVEQAMAVLVCHYDQSDVNCCEATGLSNPSAKIASLLSEYGDTMIPPSLSDKQILVLCSPSFYHQRSKYYKDVCEVRPLLFKWKSLKAQQLKKLMKLDESSTQLYVGLMLDMLRDFQRQEKVPAYEDFIRMVEDLANVPGQSSPLKQRFQMLSSFVYESDKNESLRDVGVDLADVMEAGRMVVVDLTDPMMSPADANGVFQVLLETFRFKRIPRAGKLVAFDEAHRYMGLHGESDALAQQITDCARLMRHEGMRLVISTQSPKAMPEELLELTTVLISHRFQSNDWHTYLAKKVPLPEGSFERIRSLAPGEALVYSACPSLTAQDGMGRGAEVMRVQVRKRLTADRGASRVNRKMRTVPRYDNTSPNDDNTSPNDYDAGADTCRPVRPDNGKGRAE